VGLRGGVGVHEQGSRAGSLSAVLWWGFLSGSPGRGPEGRPGAHLPTAPVPAPPGSRAPRRAAAPPPRDTHGLPWPATTALPVACKPTAAAGGRGAALTAPHRREHERGRLLSADVSPRFPARQQATRVRTGATEGKGSARARRASGRRAP
jgi:hypothetical protein